MSCSAKILLCVALAALTGCSTASRRVQARDWEDLAATPSAPAPPAIAPTPPTIPPPTKAASPAPASEETGETWVPFQRWCLANGLPILTRLATAPSPLFELRGSGGVLLLRAGSQLLHWNGLELRLGFAPQMIGGLLYLHALDLKKTVRPLFASSFGGNAGASPVVVIDPGHGGENSGTKSVLGNYYEKDLTLDWARRLQGLLAAKGCEVFLTRSNDTDLALSNRVAFAAAHKADLFLSLHFNSAAPNQTEAGLETYCLTPVGMPSSLTRGFADPVDLAYPNNAFDAQNLQLAVRVHSALLEVNGHHDRGVRRARFPGVLRGQLQPAVLIEGGYLSNPHEARLISEPDYRQRMAEALTAAVVQQLGTALADAVSPLEPGIALDAAAAASNRFTVPVRNQKPGGIGQKPEAGGRNSQAGEARAQHGELPDVISHTAEEH